jgi:hypothetical protein
MTDLGLCLHALPGESKHLHLASGERDGHLEGADVTMLWM